MCLRSSGVQHVHRRRLCLHNHHANVSSAGLLQGRRRLYHLPVSEMVSRVNASQKLNNKSVKSESSDPCRQTRFRLAQAVSGGQDPGERVRRVVWWGTETEIAQRVNFNRAASEHVAGDVHADTPRQRRGHGRTVQWRRRDRIRCPLWSQTSASRARLVFVPCSSRVPCRNPHMKMEYSTGGVITRPAEPLLLS